MIYEFKEKPEYNEATQELYPKYSFENGVFVVDWRIVPKSTKEIIVLEDRENDE